MFFRRNSFSMEANQPPETLENILRVTRTQESVLNAYYTDSNGEVVTMTLYDISETDPTDILGDDVLNSGAASRSGSERRDSSTSARFEESRRYHFRGHQGHASGGQLDPQRVQEKLRKLSNMYAADDCFDDSTTPTSMEDNDSSENDVSENDDFDVRTQPASGVRL